jgi:hypothetical protein
MTKGWLAFFFLQALVLLQVALAWSDGFLTVSDMQRHGYPVGLPLIWHFGVWGDLLLISPLAAFLIGRYSSLWRAPQICVVVSLAVATTLALGWFYTTGNLPGSHAREHRTTLAGQVHLVYMAAGISVFGLFYLHTRASPEIVLSVTLLVVTHVFFGTQLALGTLKQFIHLPWYPNEPLFDPGAWIPFLATAGFCAWRASQMRVVGNLRGV